MKTAFELFTESKKVVLNNLPVFVVLTVVPLIAGVIGSGSITGQAAEGAELQSTWMRSLLLPIIVSIIFVPFMFLAELQASQGKKLSLSKVFSDTRLYFFPVLGLLILTGLFILLGLLALIIPGIIISIRLILAPYFLIEKKLGIIDAMKQSSAATKGKSGAIWGIIGVNILLSLPSFVPVIGQYIAAVLTMIYTCAFALRYLELKDSAAPVKN